MNSEINFSILFFAILPPVVSIVLALLTKRIYISLFVGIASGAVIIGEGNLYNSFIAFIDVFLEVLNDSGNVRVLLFIILIGIFVRIYKTSNAINFISSSLIKFSTNNKSIAFTQTQAKVQLYAWLCGVILFIETNISILSVGTIFTPLFERYKISKEKLAYIADSSSSPISILIPLNAWGAFIMVLLLQQQIEKPFLFLIQSIAFNFYPIVTLLLGLFFILKNKNLGVMKSYENTSLQNKSDTNVVDERETSTGLFKLAVLPFVLLLLLMPMFLLYSGWNGESNFVQLDFLDQILSALNNSSGSFAVLISISITLIISTALFYFNNSFELPNLTKNIIDGIKDMLPMVLLMLLAFAIGLVCKKLTTGEIIAGALSNLITANLLPFILFLTASVIAFSTGTSWGTFAILIPVAIPSATALDVNLHLAVAAILGGGIFGDHCSPISDTTVISSTAAKCNHIDHVNSQLPYALTSGGIASLLYIALGFIL